MGGAMAPPMKDLPRWLEENPEFAVAPDWTDIVKQSVSNRCFFKLHSQIYLCIQSSSILVLSNSRITLGLSQY